MSRLRVLHVVSEVYPWVKTGGLGDVAGALPPALIEAGVDARILVPGYTAVLDAARDERELTTAAALFGAGPARLIAARLGESRVPAYVLDSPGLFRRPGGPYQDERGADWPDNHRRFAALGWASRWLATSNDDAHKPDVVHAHDWPGGLAVAYTKLANGPPCIATIHSIAYPGAFERSVFGELGLPESTFSLNGVEFFGRVSFLKAALYYADRITTVSPTYAREIQMEGLGGGFEGLLRGRKDVLTGILNGVDYREWNPAKDRHLPATYSARSMRGKATSKEALQRRAGVARDPKTPLFGIVSRLIWQKGIDWVVEIIPWLVASGAQLVVLGAGDAGITTAISSFARQYPDRVAALVGYDEGLAHLVQAGSDSMLVPSRSEPCGLTQLYALRYGSPPVVRRTGGLADTVVDATDDARAAGTATGFDFVDDNADALRHAIERALRLYRGKTGWRALQRSGMSQNFGWGRSAGAYAALYESVISSAGAHD